VAAELGVRGVSGDPFTYGLPYFLVTNFNLRTDDPILPQVQRGNQWHLADGLSLARGRQTLKLGFQWIGYDLAYRQSRLARGQFIFTGAFTNDPFADFLLGFPQVTNRTTGDTRAFLREDSYAGYAQYDWRVNARRRSVGVRYEHSLPFGAATC
jgi:hypothetical protein